MRRVLFVLAIGLTLGCPATRPGTTPPEPDSDAGRVLQALVLLRQAHPPGGASGVLRANPPAGVLAYECTHTSEQGIAACEQRCLAIQANAEEQHLSCGCHSVEGGCGCNC